MPQIILWWIIYIYLGNDVCSSIIKTILQTFYGFSFEKMGQKNSKNETLNLNEIAQLETEDVFKKDRW